MKIKRSAIPFAALMVGLAAYMAFFEGQEKLILLAALPFRLVGQGLRALSLSGGAGNAAAIALFVLISALPLLGVLQTLRKKQRAPLENALCIAMAAVLPFVLYRFVNPQLIGELFHPVARGAGEARQLGEVMLAMVFWSFAAAYLVLRLLRAAEGRAHKGLRLALYVLSFVMIASVFYMDLYALLVGARKLFCAAAGLPGGIGPEAGVNVGAESLLLFLRFLASAAPSLLLLYSFAPCFTLLCALEKDRFAEENAALAERAAKRAKRAITASVLLGAAYNLVQLLLARELLSVSFTVKLPLFEILLAFLLLLLAENFQKGFALADENRQFV